MAPAAASTSSRPEATGLGWSLLAPALALPWLIETHTAPWTTFYPEWSMAAALLALAVYALLGSPQRWCGTRSMLLMAALPGIALLQAGAGLMEFPQEGVVAAAYLAGFALAVWVGARTELRAPGRMAEALLASFAIAGIASVGLQLAQWLDLGHLSALMLQLPAKGRPFANVGQPNLLATLLAWGLVALWWGFERERIGGAGAMLGVAFLLLGMAMTQSRAGGLETALLGAVALAQPRSLRRPVPRAALVLLGLWFVALALVWPELGSQLGVEPALALNDQVAVGKRPAIWRLGLDAIAARPWLGWGWNQGAAAHVALAASHASIQALNPYMHNVVLDLLVWNGIPLGALLALGLAAWFVRRARAPESAASLLLLLALAALLLHSLVELPHAYTLFLLPAGLMAGAIEARRAASSAITLPPWAAAAAVVVLAVTLFELAREYTVVERDLLAWRMRTAHIANLPPPGPAPRPLLLAPLGELLWSLRVAPEPGLDAATLTRLHRVAFHFPSAANLLRLAQAEALNGQPGRAREALMLLCQVRPPTECRGASQWWRELGRNEPAFAAIEPPGAVSPERAAAGGGAGSMPPHSSEPR